MAKFIMFVVLGDTTRILVKNLLEEVSSYGRDCSSSFNLFFYPDSCLLFLII